VIDIHNHILPEVDDGAKTWDVAVEMCRMAAADGIQHMIATPHANDRYHYDRPYLQGVLNQLQERLGGTLRLGLGCDFHLSYENLQDALIHPEKYCIEGTRYLLVELSNYSVPAQITECYSQLGDQGIVPILTHPERNPILQQNMQRVIDWVQQGCVVQVTASAITGGWGERAWNAAQWLLKRNAVHILASDAHDTKHRPPGLSAAREEVADLCGKDVAQALVDDNPRAIVEAKPLPYFPDPIVKS
jgi:protein-tyrosine phosphatase